MKLEEQVVSLELAKKLKELGVKQNSLHYWQYVYAHKSYELDNGDEDPAMTYSAFTVAELGEMLHKSKYAVIKQFDGGCYFFKQHENTTLEYGMIAGRGFAPKKTEADARAKMLIYLLEHNLINSND